MFGPPLCSWPVECKKRGPYPSVVALRPRARTATRIRSAPRRATGCAGNTRTGDVVAGDRGRQMRADAFGVGDSARVIGRRRQAAVAGVRRQQRAGRDLRLGDVGLVEGIHPSVAHAIAVATSQRTISRPSPRGVRRSMRTTGSPRVPAPRRPVLLASPSGEADVDEQAVVAVRLGRATGSRSTGTIPLPSLPSTRRPAARSTTRGSRWRARSPASACRAPPWRRAQRRAQPQRRGSPRRGPRGPSRRELAAVPISPTGRRAAAPPGPSRSTRAPNSARRCRPG